jgi:hypothetical protein
MRRKHPHAPEAQIQKAADAYMGYLDEKIDLRLARRTIEKAQGMMQRAENDLTALASDPRQLQKAVDVYAGLARTDPAAARALAQGLGTSPEVLASGDTERLREDVEARAALLKAEREKLDDYRSRRDLTMGMVAKLPGAQMALLAGSGAREGSYLSERMGAVHQASEDKATRDVVIQLAVTVAVSALAAPITAGMSLGMTMATGVIGGSINATYGIALAYDELDKAKARQSSGAGSGNDIDEAERGVTIAKVAGAVSIVLPVANARIMEKTSKVVPTTELADMLSAAIQEGLGKAGEVGFGAVYDPYDEHVQQMIDAGSVRARANPAEAAGLYALQMGAEALARRPELVDAMLAPLYAEPYDELLDGEARVAVMDAFLIEYGRALDEMEPDEVQALMGEFVERTVVVNKS